MSAEPALREASWAERRDVLRHLETDFIPTDMATDRPQALRAPDAPNTNVKYRQRIHSLWTMDSAREPAVVPVR